jgi:N-acetylglucosamine-6-phosphate deacetylase
LSLPGRRAFPGFIDLHTHGLLGSDTFSAGLEEVIRLLPHFSVTAFLATTGPSACLPPMRPCAPPPPPRAPSA